MSDKLMEYEAWEQPRVNNKKELDDTLHYMSNRHLLLVIKAALAIPSDQSPFGIGMKALDILLERVDNIEPVTACGTWVD